MAEVFVISGVKMILGAVEAHVKSEISLAWGAKEELEKLQDKLVVLQLVLDDAENNRQIKEPSVRHWLEKLKNIAYDAQDVMDEVSYEANHPDNKIPVTNRLIEMVLNCCSVSNPFLSDWRISTVLNFCSSSNPFLFQWRMAHMIQDTNSKFEKIKKEMEEYNFIKGNLSHATSNPGSDDDDHRETYLSSSRDESSIVGREAEKSKLVTILTAPASEENEILSVLPIVGMGGLGKTTLVKLVCNHKDVKDYFKELQMWVYVSQDFSIKKLLTKIIKSANESSNVTDDSNLHMLVQNVQKNLGGKRFLLVLDDVWNEDLQKWEDLREALLCGAKGSKIIVTTRKYEVASLVGTLLTYQLHPLSDSDSWSLFKQGAFRNSARSEERQDLVEVGKRIVKRCGGVPLALTIIGSQLKSKGESLDAWLFIENNEIWDLPETRGILKALMVSYHLLPSHLKQCFSYCSIFRKGESIEKEELVQLWMAEGFLHPPPSTSSKTDANKVLEEDVGRQYADSLLNCCFFQAEEWNKWGHQVVSFKMHDLVHDLAQSVVSPVDQTSVLEDNIDKGSVTGSRRLQVAFTSKKHHQQHMF
ncbi:hypothetical protein Syun_005898 [Stephania yunnanensis]|uniref:Disease resistance protein RGA3 n=1 Tax=Stephania yunnanensis TaxID=152371 RepID=A0AAP0KXC1_9MAGN